ncbi:hypothetical protein, partial [Mesorhizobium sp. M1A.F.Ca.IN.020.06.1.1]|uniref:hypothetical protein n=1 Tax=Mesorhizobium sp. M1A.F.Ca.IN.020.06.1.1 TaxID=2496765 RepID=UPI0019D43C84
GSNQQRPTEIETRRATAGFFLFCGQFLKAPLRSAALDKMAEIRRSRPGSWSPPCRFPPCFARERRNNERSANRHTSDFAVYLPARIFLVGN